MDLIPLPESGELLDLTGTDEHLAAAFDELREYEAKVKAVRDAVADELRRRLDRGAMWTRRVNGYKITAPSPQPVTEYDAGELRDALSMLVAEGLIDQSAASRALKRDVSYTPVKGELGRLKKLGGRVQQVVESCERQVVRESRPVRVVIEHD